MKVRLPFLVSSNVSRLAPRQSESELIYRLVVGRQRPWSGRHVPLELCRSGGLCRFRCACRTAPAAHAECVVC